MGGEGGKERKRTYIIYMCAMYTKNRDSSLPHPCSQVLQHNAGSQGDAKLQEAEPWAVRSGCGSIGLQDLQVFTGRLMRKQTGCPCRSMSTRCLDESLDLWAMWPSLGKFHDPTCQSHCSK